MANESLPREYRVWIVLSLVVLVLSLGLVALAVGAAFFYFGGQSTPLWVVLLGGSGVFGVLVGFAGFLGMMVVAGWKSFRENRRVQVLPPEV